jgi:hypothetical protein
MRHSSPDPYGRNPPSRVRPVETAMFLPASSKGELAPLHHHHAGEQQRIRFSPWFFARTIAGLVRTPPFIRRQALIEYASYVLSLRAAQDEGLPRETVRIRHHPQVVSLLLKVGLSGQTAGQVCLSPVACRAHSNIWQHQCNTRPGPRRASARHDTEQEPEALHYMQACEQDRRTACTRESSSQALWRPNLWLCPFIAAINGCTASAMGPYDVRSHLSAHPSANTSHPCTHPHIPWCSARSRRRT